MKRILIIGSGGAGKSTLARQLGEKLSIPVVHLDQLWWLPGWVERDRTSFDALLTQEISKPAWIIDGNFDRTLPARLERCDTVIYLDYSRFACIWGVIKRIVTTYGKVRPDMGDGCPERFDLGFLKWVWNFNKDHRCKYQKLLADAHHAKVYIFKNRRQLKKFLSNQ